VGLFLTRRDRGAANPSEARRGCATDRARHHAALVTRSNNDLSGPRWVSENDNPGVLA
jgi:hypothetical protein